MGEKERGLGYLPLLSLRVLLRRPGASLLLAAVAALGVYAGCGLHSLEVQQQRAIEDTMRNTVIHCTVTDVRGMNADNLNLLSPYVEMLLGRKAERDPSLADMDKAVANVNAKADWELAWPYETTLCRLLSQASDSRLDSAQISFEPGWDESALMGGEMVCLIPEGMETDGDYLDIVAAPPIDVSMSLRVVGRVSGGPEDVIYCPFFMPWEDGLGMAFSIQSCTFDIRDTARLEECKEKLFSTPFFVVPSVNATPDGLAVGVLVHDEVYLKSLEELRSNLDMLRLLQPLLLVLMGGISFFAGYLVNRRRKREFAAMRCLGMRRRAIFGQVLGEQLALGLAGGLVGLCAALATGLGVRSGGLAFSGAVVGMFLLGAAVCAGVAASGSVMKLMKTEE
ncbi:MAG: ABC transporter permease [Oscillospiraceae bacterium]|nr:ABC transporter permease [Oscillospiraceae bacterium]